MKLQYENIALSHQYHITKNNYGKVTVGLLRIMKKTFKKYISSVNLVFEITETKNKNILLLLLII